MHGPALSIAMAVAEEVAQVSALRPSAGPSCISSLPVPVLLAGPSVPALLSGSAIHVRRDGASTGSWTLFCAAGARAEDSHCCNQRAMALLFALVEMVAGHLGLLCEGTITWPRRAEKQQELEDLMLGIWGVQGGLCFAWFWVFWGT
jgi:hypothetical protein